MTVLLVGSGAREHALARALRRNPDLTLVTFASSANPGIRTLSAALTVGSLDDPSAVTAFALRHRPDFAVIGPEAPLAAGVVDALASAGIPSVGPTRQLAQIETSKGFARDLLARRGLPTPLYRRFETANGAEEFLRHLGDRYVVKADGLMGGKGVRVSGDHLHSRDEALAWCRELEKAGRSFLIEEKLEGEEFSLMSFCDGRTLVHMPPVQDHKRAFEGDMGPNTGGMGSYSDADNSLPFLRPRDVAAARATNEETAAALREEFGEGFRGILYGGFMATASGVKVVEYNARFGDPEVINILAILETDLAEICRAIVQGTLDQLEIRFSPLATVCKYAVPEGYPDRPAKGQPIAISPELADTIFFAAVDDSSGTLIQTGSRAAAAMGVAPTLAKAEAMAEEKIRQIGGPLFHRKDIGTGDLISQRVAHMRRLRSGTPVRLAVIGSTRGTDMESVSSAISGGVLNATIEIVISDREDAFILERARRHSISARHILSKGKSRRTCDREISRLLCARDVDLILLIGYMRIFSPDFCREWEGRILNVHPSLLPAFAGGMDLDVHRAVLDAGVTETGCTVHLVTEEVDAGPIVVQKRCSVLDADTPESLKVRVQALEGEAIVEAIRLFAEQGSFLKRQPLEVGG